jgi:hypothetical protein
MQTNRDWLYIGFILGFFPPVLLTAAVALVQ